MLDLIRWMYSYNQQHPADPVQFVGVDIVAVRALAYHAVAAYVEQVAPQQLSELERHYAVLRPKGDIAAHVRWYRSQQDKQPFIDHARQAYDLVRSLPPHDGQALALQHARAIVSFYEYHALSSVGYRDQRMAENTIWWHEHTGDKTIYWAASPHTANGNPITISYPPFPPATHRSAGAYLRDYFGRGYMSIALTFYRGSVNAGFKPQPYMIPAPPHEFADSTLGSAGLDIYMLDLHVPRPPAVRAWIESPTKVRVIGPAYDPANDAAYHLSGGSLAEWFDVIIHSQEVTPTRLLP
jgi:erythromycin esterase